MKDTPVALIMFLALGAVALVLALLLVRSQQELSRLRLRSERTETELESASRRSTDLGARLRAVESELKHLTNARIPDLAASLSHSGVPVRGALGSPALTPELERSIGAVLGQVKEQVLKERRRVDFAAQAAMRGTTTTIQALLYQMQSLLQRMQEKYDDPLVAEDLLSADFLNERALRRIQATAVVCGAWPGLTRENSHLADIVIGAMSRLNGYERIQVTNQLRDPVGVVARAVEPVAVTLTELMANALHHSRPDLPVVVTLQQGNRGVSVIVDDAGVGMHADEMARAKRLMSGEERLLLTELGDPPRNGFAAVGQLVRQYGFGTHVETSPYGGVRAVVHIPGEPLLTLIDEEQQPMSAMAPTAPVAMAALPERAGAGSGPAPDAGSGPETEQAEELPRRRRRRPVSPTASASAPASTTAAQTTGGVTERGGAGSAASGSAAARGAGSSSAVPAAPVPTPEESAQTWSALQQGTESGRAAAVSGTTRTREQAAGSSKAGPEESVAMAAEEDAGPDGDNSGHADGFRGSGSDSGSSHSGSRSSGTPHDSASGGEVSGASVGRSDGAEKTDPPAPEGNPPA